MSKLIINLMIYFLFGILFGYMGYSFDTTEYWIMIILLISTVFNNDRN
jgi:hypothetical protein